MGTPGPTGNGCSLEDCYTNLFAVTDLCGIRWRRLESENVPFDQLDDPILVSWSKCIQNGFLSVWRKVIHRPQDHAISYSRELWVFYYGNEPPLLQSILSNDLKEVERGSWDKDREKDTGLNYECRTLIFKALHNLIERSFLSKNFIRLGKWFVRPYDHTSASDKNLHLSVALNFLLHGESQVCASLEARLHPPVWRLTLQHLTLVQENHATFQVILGPYGLSGTLTGNAYRDVDQASCRIMEEWRSFYPIPEPEGKENDPTRPPNVVEVIVAGCRMYYPSHYVLICENDDAAGRIQPMPGTAPANVSRPACMSAPMLSNALMTPPTSPGDPSAAAEPGVKVVPVPSVNTGLSESSQILAPVSREVLSCHLTRKVIQDACTSIGSGRRNTEPEDAAAAAGTWCLNDPCTKVSCLCRHRRSKSAVSSNKNLASSKHGKGDKPEKSDRQQTRHRPAVPFHRRPATEDDLLQFGLDAPMPHPAFCPTGGTTVAPPSTPGAREETPMDIAPAAPLPLDEPQPPANSNHDPPMPTLSPHPPAKLNGDGDFATKSGANSDSQPSVMCNGFPEYYKGGEDSASKPVTTNSPGFGPSTLEPYKNESVSMWLESQRTQTENHGLKMPRLPTKETDCDDVPEMSSLYNFSPDDDWMNLVVKKPRIEATCDNVGSPQQPPGEASHSQRAEAPPPTSPVSDPFEFSDENSNSLNPNSGLLSRGKRKSRDEIFPRPSPLGRMDSDSKDNVRPSTEVFPKDESVNDLGPLGTPPTPGSTLMRERDLVPKAGDLDHIFDSSGEDSDDAACSEVGTSNNKACKPISQSELTRMYPTPPSDTIKAASPDALTDVGASEVAVHEVSTGKVDNYMYTPSVCDSSFKEEVFRPPSKVPFATAPKYNMVTLAESDHQTLSGFAAARNLFYKPLLHFNMPLMEKPQPQPNAYINSIENIPSLTSRVPNESSPAFMNCLRTPMSQELQSPASNASSYLNRTLNSIENPRTNQQLPEIHSLVVNVILSDSILNLFKDHNFDSCNICACNSDIKGSDIGPYLPDPGTSTESSFTCRCGFSAVMNRQYGYNAGLFYEDEVEITGIRDDRYDHRKPSLIATHQLKEGEKEAKDVALPEDVPQFVLELLLSQFNTAYPSFVTNHLFEELHTATSIIPSSSSINYLLMRDGNEAVYAALELGRQAMEHCSPNKLDDPNLKNLCLHRWPYLRDANRLPHTSQDVLQVLKAMQPLLQEAVHQPRGGRLGEKLLGPLTWKEFHQLAGRGSDENCEPQPIPYLLVGYDRDWLSVSPFSVRFWDKQFMEPFARQRDVAYLVIAPDNDYSLSHVKAYFSDLSTMYEQSRLGKHRPGVSVLRDGIVRVGRKSLQNLAETQVDEWFSQIGDTPLASKLKLFAQVCGHHLGPLLAKHLKSLDKSIFETPHTPATKPVFKTPEPAAPTHPPTPESQNSTSATTNSEEKAKEETNSQAEAAAPHKENTAHEAESDDPSACPAVVIYLVNPFTYGREWDDLDRLAMVGLLRAFREMIKVLPEHLQNNIYLQMVPLSTVMNHDASAAHSQTLKSMAFSVFTGCRWNLSHSIMGRSLTGFGPAAAAEQFLKKKEPEKGAWVKMYAPPFVLAPLKDKQRQLAESCGEKTEKGTVVFCTYCLSEDQRWLLGTVTDERGEMMETVNINIEIPNRNRRKKASARKVGLQRLWDFLVEVISSTTLQVRLVVGRFGRIGHSELKGWAGLLSKTNLLSLNKRMESCSQCNMMPSSERSCLLSASLVSLEPQPSMQVLWECVKVEEKVASSCPLQTPRDASCTHILVFPTSATAQAHSPPLAAEAPMSLGDQHLEFGDVFSDLREEEYLTHMDDTNLFEDINLDNIDVMPPSPQQVDGLVIDDRGKSSNKANCSSNANSGSAVHDPQSGEVNLLQQPLAMGYYISTAKSGPLPKWFWSACPENEHIIPHAFKSALHIHSITTHEEFSSTRNSHPLDSYTTCDVLRFVLENYNSLSWLTYDPVKNDRRSCLPIHMVVLMQMYHALNAFV